MRVNKFIQSIRDIFGYYPDSSKGCKKFAELLVGVFGGDLFYNHEHYIALIDGIYYDLYGSYVESDLVQYPFEGQIKSVGVSNFLPVEMFGKDHIDSTFDFDLKYETGL